MPPNTISVARPSKWGNPFKVGPELRCEGVFIPAVTQERAVELYREWLTRSVETWPSMAEAIHQLRGINLACYCPLPPPGEPDICHAAVLLEFANAGEMQS